MSEKNKAEKESSASKKRDQERRRINDEVFMRLHNMAMEKHNKI